MGTYTYGLVPIDDDEREPEHEQVKCPHCGFWFYKDEGCECQERPAAADNHKEA